MGETPTPPTALFELSALAALFELAALTEFSDNGELSIGTSGVLGCPPL